jgi:hypothetical protein
MGANIILNRDDLVKQLEPIKYSEEEWTGDPLLEQMSFAASLLKLADIDHEKEYELCHSVAEHLLPEVPEPDVIEQE